MIDVRELQDAYTFGPTPVVVIAGGHPTGTPGEVAVTRGEALRLLDDLAELVNRWR